MEAMRSTAIPASVIRRMTKYLTALPGLCAVGRGWVSSQDLAGTLGLTSSTVRQDLSYLDFQGVSRRGYRTDGLMKVLSDVLGSDKAWNMIVVGAGNLGRALALHEEFARRGFNIRGVFDSDAKKIGKRIGRLTVQSVCDIPGVMRSSPIDIGVVAVPAAAAQSTADILIACRVRGLLNLTQTHIVAPQRVPVVDARIVANLQELAHAISTMRRSAHTA